MKILYDEITQRFPEIRDWLCEGDEELPYLIMGYLADWLKVIPSGEITPDIIARLVAFYRWCKEQPRGAASSDDLHTIWVVAFFRGIIHKRDDASFATAIYVS